MAVPVIFQGCSAGDPRPPADLHFPLCPPSSLIVTQKIYKTSPSINRHEI
jgi:hypothetical protein